MEAGEEAEAEGDEAEDDADEEEGDTATATATATAVAVAVAFLEEAQRLLEGMVPRQDFLTRSNCSALILWMRLERLPSLKICRSTTFKTLYFTGLRQRRLTWLRVLELLCMLRGLVLASNGISVFIAQAMLNRASRFSKNQTSHDFDLNQVSPRIRFLFGLS